MWAPGEPPDTTPRLPHERFVLFPSLGCFDLALAFLIFVLGFSLLGGGGAALRASLVLGIRLGASQAERDWGQQRPEGPRPWSCPFGWNQRLGVPISCVEGLTCGHLFWSALGCLEYK